MSFQDVANSGLLWGLVIGGIIIVAAITIYYAVICYKKAIEMGMSREKLQAVIKSSALFSIVPSIAIVAGLASLVVVIGLPYGWFRLSVLGSVAYEIMAADMALSALNLDVATANAEAFGLMAWAMCIGITVTLVFNLFLCKRIHLGSTRLGGDDPRWSPLAQSVFMTALLCALTVPMIFGGLVSLLTFVTSMVIALVVSKLAQKTGAAWLGQFTLAFSLFGAMCSSVLWDKLL